jgi:hypothetical protein
VATTEFAGAARAQSGYLGRPDYDLVYVQHPIQDQTKEEIEARADQVISEIVAELVQPGSTEQPSASGND